MTTDKTGGPAFPQFYRVPGSDTIVGPTGMTLWDWYAGQAIGIASADANLVNSMLESNMSGADFVKTIATACALMADAILAERKKRGIV